MGVRALFYSGIAASLVLAVWIQRPRQEEDYAIIRGRRIDNPEYAQRYAEKKLNDVNEMLQHRLKPLRDAETLKENLRNVSEGGSDKSQIIE
jgi:predicted HTH domain antitoxin